MLNQNWYLLVSNMNFLILLFFSSVIFAGSQGELIMTTSNTLDAKTFLEKNKSQDGVHVLDNGLQYKIEKSGEGVMPKSSDEVTVMYEGKLTDGTIFDSSYARGAPATFRVDQVIKGWQDALQKMREGDVWILYIPAELAYGERGVSGVIPPNSTLIFKVELQKVSSN